MRVFALALALLTAGGQDSFDWAREGRDCADLLRDLIRIDTINPPPEGSGKTNADETRLCEHVKAVLQTDGIESEIFEAEPGRGSLVARLKGDGSRKPVLLMAHIDVVGVDRGKWSCDPVSGDERDGYIWGRGAIDDKGMDAVIIHVVRMLKRRGAKLSRDVILMLNADEESGGRKGAQWMAEKHLEKIDAEFVLNEGGRINLKDGKIVQFAVQCAEKIYNDVRLWVRGTSGHSSVPRADNAIYNAAGMLLKLQGYETPIRVTEIARAYFAGIADLAAYAEHRELMKRLPDPKAAAELAARDPKFNAILRTTFVPTLVKGGIRVNVLPPDVEININVRLLPGDKIDELLRGLSRHLGLAETPILNAAEFEAWKKELEESLRAGKPASQVAWVKDLTDEDAPATPLDTAFLEAVRGAAKELAPEASVVPFMSTGATDSRFFRSRGRHAYGLMPLPVTDEEEKGFHGHDERVRLTSVTFGVRLLYEVVTRLAR